MDRLLSYGPGADERFAAAREADEGLALAHAGRALLALFRGDAPAARAAIADASRLAAGATRRERQHAEALSAIIGGDGALGLALVDVHVKEFPRDALLVNQASSTVGFGGRADREAFRAAFLERGPGQRGVRPPAWSAAASSSQPPGGPGGAEVRALAIPGAGAGGWPRPARWPSKMRCRP